MLGCNKVPKVPPGCKPAVAWEPQRQRPGGGDRVGKLSRGSVGRRTYYICIMRLQKGEHRGRRAATRAERGWAIIHIPWRRRSVG